MHMIDIHSHILPFMDDGAADWEAALAMAKDAHADGITTVIATPHHANGQYMNSGPGIRQAVELMNERLHQNNIPLQVLSGQEIRVYGELLYDLEQGELLSLAGSRYMLLEMPSSRIPRNMAEVCHELVIQGFVPVIAHPERNAEVASDPSRLESLMELGVLGQVTAQSLAGAFGSKLQKLSLELCRRNLVHVIASDAHDCAHRPFGLSEAHAFLDKELGAEANDYFRRNAQHIVANSAIIPGDYTRVHTKRHKIFGFFSRKG
ncbi:tyrosine-protein phosphatase [Paenibacillus albidus]|uniref:tyrosine-protein phosphatase n=1 Tax=Paenibacillus albidus TaxID=2041023 RepID=UPI00288A9392|nr:CpsB/CapC family capsule biosynthesis tyrosine phosphatase [Paenibacillus albidus]